MLPLVALVGRPNVGKSTLFNRLLGSRDALTANSPGLTRDRRYGLVDRDDGAAFALVDTAGLRDSTDGPLDKAVRVQTEQALAEADLLLLLVDAREGLNAVDQQIASELRRGGHSWAILVNKIDGCDATAAIADFSALGSDQMLCISATHGLGIGQLRLWLQSRLAAVEPDPSAADREGDIPIVAEAAAGSPLRIALLGRPNCGKSTLVNRLLGRERMVVSEVPGTTRDSIGSRWSLGGRDAVIIDTAGIRRRSRVQQVEEKFSILMSLRALHQAELALVLMDLSEGVVVQDCHLLGAVLDAGRAAVVVLNKIDRLNASEYQRALHTTERMLNFAPYVERVPISARNGRGVGKLLSNMGLVASALRQPLHTTQLNQALGEAVADFPPPYSGRHPIKLRYAHGGGQLPPIIVIHGSQAEKTPAGYRRYLAGRMRKALGLHGVPLQLIFKTTVNPFAGRRNRLSPRQQARRQRLISRERRRRS